VLVFRGDELFDPHVGPSVALEFEAANPLGPLSLLGGEVRSEFPVGVLHRVLLASVLVYVLTRIHGEVNSG